MLWKDKEVVICNSDGVVPPLSVLLFYLLIPSCGKWD